MTQQQAEFLKSTFEKLFGCERTHFEASWYEYKSHSDPLELAPRVFTGFKIFPISGQGFGFQLDNDYGIISCPFEWKDISIDADDYTIHFRYLRGERIKCYRAFRALPDDMYDGTPIYKDETYKAWQSAMRESWKI